MTLTTLAALLENPPLRTTELRLNDSIICKIYELPVSVFDRVRTISEEEDDDVNMDDIVFVAAWALAGRKPTDDELAAISDRFGTRSVMAIYFEALKFSQLDVGAVEREKKH